MSDDSTTPATSDESGDPTAEGIPAHGAVEAAAARAENTAGRNITAFSELPIPEDTANLRFGPDLHPGLLALLPLVGVWQGEGEADTKDRGQHRFGQQIIISHDGENYLSWSSRCWTLDDEGNADIPAYRESGFWRISESDELEFLCVHASGVVEVYYGRPVHQAAWQLATDATMSSPTGPQLGGATRLYGIVEDGDLGWVEERIHPEKGQVPHMSARLKRLAG